MAKLVTSGVETNRVTKRRVGLLLGVSVLWLPLSMLFNSLQSLILPVYVLRFVAPAQKGTALGLLLFVGLACGALVQPLVGSYSDALVVRAGSRWARWGRRLPFVLIGAIATLAFLGGFVLAVTIWELAFVYIGVSIAAGIAQAGAQGLLPDLVPGSQRGSASGLKGGLELTGSLVGFAVAGALLKHGHLAWALASIAILLAAGVALTLWLTRQASALPQSDASAMMARPQSPQVGAVTALAQHVALEHPTPSAEANVRGRSVFARVMISRGLFLLAVYGIGHFLLFYLHDHLHIANPAAATGSLLSVLTLATALFAFFGGWLSDRWGRIPMHWAAGILSAAGALLLIPASSLGAVLVADLLLSVGSGLFASANWALTADLAPAGQGGRFYGLLALATGAATAFAGLFGLLVDAHGYSALFALAALSFMASIAVLPRAATIAQVARHYAHLSATA